MLSPRRNTEDAEQYRLAQVVEGNPVATIVIDDQHRITHWNRACELLTGMAAVEMVGSKDQWRAFYPQQRPILADLIVDGALDGDVDQFYHGKFRRSAHVQGAFEAEDFFPAFGDGGRWLYFTAAVIRDVDGRTMGAIETLQDITEQRRAELALREKEAFLAQIVDGSSVATLVIDRHHRVTHWNRACELLTGIAAGDMIGTRRQWQPFYGSERPILADAVLDGTVTSRDQGWFGPRCQPSALVRGGFENEDFFPGFGGGGKWLFFTAAPLRDGHGQVIGAIETLQDVTERRLAEEALRASEESYRLLSVTDALTGLFNSRHFYQRLEVEIERAGRYRRPLSLLAIDADHFKAVNDTHGHLEGDKVLQSLATVIRQCLRRTDSAYRYGGEEFIVLLPEAVIESAAVLAERLRKSFFETLQGPQGGKGFRCSVSIGVAEFIPGEDGQSLVRRADEAAYQAKRRGRNCVVVTGSG